jgi:hypothetical protein
MMLPGRSDAFPVAGSLALPKEPPMLKNFAITVLLPLLTSTALWSQPDARSASSAALRAELAARPHIARASQGSIVTACESQIACGQTVVAELVEDCQFQDGSAIDLFQFNGTAGQTVTITASTADFPPFFDLEEPVTFASLAIGEGTETTPAVASAVLDATGTWTIGVSNFGEDLQTGTYALSLACSGAGSSPGCTPDATTLCLRTGRFKVTASYDAGGAGAGPAQVVPLTDDTGYLWFFDPSNVEAVVKVLDGCDVDGDYWVFAGGLTDVKVTLTVTDTQTGARKRYVNPSNTTFQPIQDTVAFGTCP